MFSSRQIITASEFVRKFKFVADYMTQYPLPLLITQKNGEHFVFVHVDMFEKLVEQQLEKDGVAPPPFSLKENLKYN